MNAFCAGACFMAAISAAEASSYWQCALLAGFAVFNAYVWGAQARESKGKG